MTDSSWQGDRCSLRTSHRYRRHSIPCDGRFELHWLVLASELDHSLRPNFIRGMGTRHESICAHVAFFIYCAWGRNGLEVMQNNGNSGCPESYIELQSPRELRMVHWCWWCW